MAEAMAVIGLVAAILQFAEFGAKVSTRMKEFQSDMGEGPRVYHSVQNRIPLMLDLVSKIHRQIQEGRISKTSQEVMLPVMQSCLFQVKTLDELLAKGIPRADDSAWKKGRKAFYSVIKESEMEKVDRVLRSNFDLLVQAGIFHQMERSEQTSYYGGSHYPYGTVPGYTQQSPPQINPGFPPGYGSPPLPGHSGFSPFASPPIPGYSNYPDQFPTGPRWSIGSQSDKSFDLPLHRSSTAASTSGSSLSSTNADGSSKIFMVNFHRDPKFLPRKKIVEEIDTRMANHRLASIAGLGGVGKSQIAIEYCFMFRDKYPDAHVFWVFAGSKARFEEGYQQIARRLNLPGYDDPDADVLQLVCEYLTEKEDREWLLAIDNCDDADVFFSSNDSATSESTKRKPFSRYIPHSKNGSVLITTRDKRVGERLSGRQKPIEVLPLDLDDSKSLLRQRIIEEDWDEDAATELVEQLAHLPLAITQAAAFISENCVSIVEYLELLAAGESDFQELLSEQLEDSRRDFETENSVMRTWRLSFEQLHEKKPRAAQILSLMSVLDYHQTPQSLIRRSGETEVSFKTALGTLQAFSLVTSGKGKDAACRMHRLVALSTQKWLKLRDQLHYWQSEALKMISTMYPERPTFDSWKLLEALTPHASLVFTFAYTAAEDLLQAASLMSISSLYDMETGRYSDACDKCTRAFEIRESLLPENHPLTLSSIQTLGEALLHIGNLSGAKTMLERAITDRKIVIGEDHPDTLESCSDLTICLLELNDLKAAEQWSLTALNGRQKVLGEEHEDTIVSLNINTMFLHRKGRLEDAKKQYQEVLAIRKKILAEGHYNTVMTMNNWGRLLYDSGDLAEAAKVFESVVTQEEKLLGPENFDLQISLTNYSLVKAAKGDLEGAEVAARRALSIRQKRSGDVHPYTVQSLRNLASILEQRNKNEEAARLRRHAAEQEIKIKNKDIGGALTLAGLLYD